MRITPATYPGRRVLRPGPIRAAEVGVGGVGEAEVGESGVVEVGEVEDEAVADVAPVQAVEGLVHAGGGEEFDVGGDAVLGAEGQHLGGALPAAAARGAEFLAADEQVEGLHGDRSEVPEVAERASSATRRR